jgi:hypothetical protein
MTDPKVIYLQPKCCEDPSVGRLWCEDDVMDCEDGNSSTKYIKAGTMTAEQILKNVQSKIADKLNGDPLTASEVDYCNFLEWIDREISKALEEHE